MVIARLVLHDEHPVVIVLVAFACILGHNYSIFLRGKGGKGVATGAGAALALMPIPMAIVVVIFVVLLVTTRVVSIASIVATIMFPVMAVVFAPAARLHRRRVRHGGGGALGSPGQLSPAVEASGAAGEVPLEQDGSAETPSAGRAVGGAGPSGDRGAA